MRVLLTGAFGNVGTETIRELLAAGHQVRTFDLATPRNEKIAAQFGRQIEIGWGDLTKPGDLLAAVADREAVIHDAAIIPPASENDADLTHAVNVEGTRNVIAACEAQPSMPRLVFTSSVTVFGPCQDKAPPRRVDEPLVPTDNYTHSKVRCEEMIRASRLSWVILRLGGVIPIELDSSRGVDLDDFFASDLSSRIEYVHPLDVGLAQTRAIACDEAQGRVLLIGGGASSQIYMRDLLTAFFEAVGIGAPLDSWFNGDPFYTDWMDSEESQRLLAYQRHDFPWYRADLHDRMRVTRLFVRPLRWPIRGYLSYRSRVSARREGVVK